MNSDSKKEFISLLKKGDESAFTELINTYNRRLFAYAISLSGDYSLAKDIVQNVFVKTFEFGPVHFSHPAPFIKDPSLQKCVNIVDSNIFNVDK